ncbi:MipA/OmpV family protein [Sphingomonas sp. LHG3406-1]|uniref:MipA/OmpV family protein n=1 Tax=Sphingomonas sp. LHG3406-1 TaxID=2804617 RepID=UPI00262A0071|nr:MipA/OmpV family protein [Sphingomonas sp. LHG3406-1]
MKHLILACAVLATAVAAPAYAQENEDLRVRVGIGAQVRPEFVGAEDREVGPLFDIDVARGDKPFQIEAPDDSFGLRLVNEGGFVFGPAANIAPSRKERDVGAPVGKVKTTLEVGGFAEYLLTDSFRLRGQLLKGVNGHEGLVGSIGADAIFRDGDRYAATLGPRLLWSDSRYQLAYFGVSPAASLAAGLPVYRPGGGVHAVALAGGLTTQLGPRWGLFGYARAERLVGDAARSPIVREYGSRNQLSAGLGLSYVFRVER